MRPTPKDIRAQFRLFNAYHFRGLLPPVALRWRPLETAYAVWYYPEPRWPNGCIVLSAHDDAACGWRGVLLHECIHAWLELRYGYDFEADTSAESEHHGPVFTRECNRIGARLGLPPIDEDSSWSWPHGLWVPSVDLGY